MSPTVLRIGSARLFFFSREESRPHVHVHTPDGEAKFWLEPEVELADSVGLESAALTRLEGLVKEHVIEIRAAWRSFFGA